MSKVALVVGVTGITGNNIADELVTQGWKVYGLCRKPSQVAVTGVVYIYSDVQKREKLFEDITEVLGITHLFYATWSRQETETKNCEVNGTMFRNSLEVTSRFSFFRHCVLITGLKHYLGSFDSYGTGPLFDTPFREAQGRLPGENFYYTQEDILFKVSESKGFTWSVHRPHSVIGFCLGNAMNMGVTLAVYASICKETGAPFLYPGSRKQFNGITDVTDAKLLAKHAVWSADPPHDNAKNQAYNSVNGDVFRWRQLWSVLCAYFDLPDPGFPEAVSPLEPRMGNADEIWSAMVEKYSLKPFKATELASWWHTDADLGRQVENFTDMSKCREMGFKEFQTTSKSFTDLFDRLKAENIIP